LWSLKKKRHTKIERRKSITTTRSRRRSKRTTAATHKTSKENDARKINRKWENQRAPAKCSGECKRERDKREETRRENHEYRVYSSGLLKRSYMSSQRNSKHDQ